MKTIQDVQKNILVKYYKLKEEQAQEVMDMLNVLGLKISDVYINSNTDPISISLNYHFYLSKAIESGQLKNLRVWVKGDRAYVVVNREGLGEFKLSLHKSEVDRKNVNWQSMPETMLKKTAIKRAIKLVFADLYSTYEIINLPASKKDKENKFQNKDWQNYQKDYSKNIADSYLNKNQTSQSQTNKVEQNSLKNEFVSVKENSEIEKIRKEINQIRIKNNISQEEFKNVIRDAKDLIFSDPDYKMETEHDYIRLKNFLEKKYQSS